MKKVLMIMISAAAVLFPVIGFGEGGAKTEYNKHFLSIVVEGSGEVKVAEFKCDGHCTIPFENGAEIVLTAEPATGWVFSGWSDDCSGKETCKLTMNVDRNVAVKFAMP